MSIKKQAIINILSFYLFLLIFFGYISLMVYFSVKFENSAIMVLCLGIPAFIFYNVYLYLKEIEILKKKNKRKKKNVN